MKKLFPWMYCLFIIGSILQSCEDKVKILEPVKVQFTCNLADSDEGGRTLDFNEPVLILLSVEDNSGNPIFTRIEVQLLRIGDSYISDPLELLPGNYRVTDFLLVDALYNVLYAVPLRGSPLGDAVVNPLPWNLRVNRDQINTQEMEVIDVTIREPEEFGYISFDLDAVHPLSISVFAEEDGMFEFTEAKAYILQNSDTVDTFDLKAEVNLISFGGDPDERFELFIVKSGYEDYYLEFRYEELLTTLNGLPLKVFLDESGAGLTYTFLAWADATSVPDFYFEFNMAGNNNPITIDWGDGTSEPFTVSPGLDLFTHTFPSEGNFEVTITGDLSQIFHFKTYYGAGKIDSINLSEFTNLRVLEMGLTRCPATIDMTNNTKIVTISMPGSPDLQELLLPATNEILVFEVEGPNTITPTSIDQMIDNIYQSAVAAGRMNGIINIASFWVPPYNGMVGPPSESTLVKLRELESVYNWTIYPKPVSFFMLAWAESTLPPWRFYVRGGTGTLDVDWGDGSSDTYTLTPDIQWIEHTYSITGNYEVCVTGDVDQIDWFYSFYGEGPIDLINVQGLTNLTSFRHGLTRGPMVIDLSNNHLIDDVLVSGIPQLEQLILSDDNRIRSIGIEGPNVMYTATVDDVIQRVYNGAIMHGTLNGTFGLSISWSPMEPYDLVGPPSPAAMALLYELKNNYGWTLYPIEYFGI